MILINYISSNQMLPSLVNNCAFEITCLNIWLSRCNS